MNSYLLGTHADVYVTRGLRLNANCRRPSPEDPVGHFQGTGVDESWLPLSAERTETLETET